MGLRFRKSFKAGPFRITASKSGVSTSFGGKGARITKTASGKTRTTISIPGTGLSYVSETGKKRKPKFQNYSPEYLAAVEMVQAEKEQEAWMAANKRKLRKKPKPPKEQELSISAVKRTGILFVIVGIPLSLLFLPVGLAVLAYGVYQIIKAPTVLEKMKALQASEVEKYQVALAEWEAQQGDESVKPASPVAGSHAHPSASGEGIRCVKYSVKGKNPASGRRKTVMVVSDSSASLTDVQERSGLLPPYDVEQIELSPPSEAQIRYASKLGFAFPPDATSSDATIFLTRAEAGLPLMQPVAPEWMVRYVIGKGIFVPAYANSDEVSASYLFGCSKRDKTAFFCMRVFCAVYGKRYCTLEEATPDEVSLFYEFADAFSENEEFSRSLDHYGADDLPLDRCIVPKRLKAFNLASAYLEERELKP